jgi:copper chaperone CopZ
MQIWKDLHGSLINIIKNKTKNTMKTLQKTTLRSDELNCPSCVNNIEGNLNKMEGIERAKVHFSTGRIEVEYDSDIVSENDLIDAVRKSGYVATVSPF